MLIEQTDVQSKAIRAMLGDYEGIETSYVQGQGYDARPYIDEWHNCRENGYVITLNHYSSGKCLVLAFFEHRNTDSVHIVKWVSDGGWLNPPTINDVPEDVYTSKWDTAAEFKYGQIGDAATYIYNEMNDFWGRMNDACKSGE